VFLKAITWLGVAFLVAAACSYIQAIREEDLNAQPVALPVSLAPGTIKLPEFRTDIDYWEYEIALDFENKLDWQRMDCLIGGEANQGRCKGIANLIDISWELFEGEKVASEGNSANTPGMLWEPTVLYERTIGIFKAEKGHHYTLVLHVTHDASELSIANPKIVVQIRRGYWDDRAVGIGIQKLFAGALGLIGMMILVGALAIPKLKRARSDGQK
jgi:hypothetical protein